MTDRYAGTVLIARHALRRDRLLAGLWGAVLVLVVYASAAATPGLYPTAADRVQAAEAINNNPALVALYGPVLDPHSLGELAMTKVTVLYTVVLALLFIVMVRRHTRSEEEQGQAELISATAVGRDSALSGTALESLIVAVTVSALAAAASIAAGLPATGSIAFGAMWLGSALVAISVGALSCQLAASSRTCFAIAAAILGALYLMRAVGDVGAEWLSWLSPLGWNTRLDAWSHPRWWVLLLDLGAALVVLVCAQLLRWRRDSGLGLYPPRPGPVHASAGLRGTTSLVWRVQRANLAGWTAGLLVVGAAMGGIAPRISEVLDTGSGRTMLRDIGGTGALEDTLLAAVLSLVTIAACCFGIAVVVNASSDERTGRTEEVLATAQTRVQVLRSTLLLALAGASWLMAVTGFAMALTAQESIGRIVAAAAGQLPAVWLTIALATLLQAARGAWAPAGWGLLAIFFLLGQIGDLLRLPTWLQGVSPFEHTARMPVEALDGSSAAAMAALAAAVAMLATWRFGSRDIA